MLYSHPTEFEDAVILLLHRLFGIGLQVAHRAGDDGIDASFDGNPSNLLFREYQLDRDRAKWVMQIKVTFDRDAKRSILRAIAKETLSQMDTDFYVLVTNADLKRKTIDEIRGVLKDRLPEHTEVLVWSQRKLEMLACLTDSKNFIPSLGIQAVFREWEDWLVEFEPNTEIEYPYSQENGAKWKSWHNILERRCNQGSIRVRCWDFASLMEVPYLFHTYHSDTGISHLLTNKQYRQLVMTAYEIQRTIDTTNARPIRYDPNYLLGNLLGFGKSTFSVADGLKELVDTIPESNTLIMNDDFSLVFPIRTIRALAGYLLPKHDPAVLIHKQMALLDPWIWDYTRRYLYADYLRLQGLTETLGDVYSIGMRGRAVLHRLISNEEMICLQSFLDSVADHQRNFGNWCYGGTENEYMVDRLPVLGMVSIRASTSQYYIPDDYHRCYVIPYNKMFTSTDIGAIDDAATARYIAIEFDRLLAFALQWQKDGQSVVLHKKSKETILRTIHNGLASPNLWRDI